MGGYDPAQVRAAIDERDERLVQLEREAQQLARRVIETEKRLQEALPKMRRARRARSRAWAGAWRRSTSRRAGRRRGSG